MSTVILSKCIEELKKDAPDVSYLRGALETLLELSNPTPVSIVPPILPKGASSDPTYKTIEPVDEEDTELARRYTGGPIGGLQ